MLHIIIMKSDYYFLIPNIKKFSNQPSKNSEKIELKKIKLDKIVNPIIPPKFIEKMNIISKRKEFVS